MRSFKKNSGFTLVETIIGIVVLAISFSILSSLLFPAAKQSAEQVHQIKAAELGQSMLNEILARAFDENSDMAGGRVRCGESGLVCTLDNGFGADAGENSRALYDDVDDYENLDDSGTDLVNSLGTSIASLYLGYRVRVMVCHDSNYNGVCDKDESITNTVVAKLITVTITTPQGFDIVFSSYKANF
ncbi:MAG: prepilin-type N-terminal cleavage/methylation domain-containing protein [Colwellia sp.]|nr:prepilin-type N-terminal cleavage/methylation domain-containing protein [Colwellia sp.]